MTQTENKTDKSVQRLIKRDHLFDELVEALELSLERLSLNNCEGEENKFIKQLKSVLSKIKEASNDHPTS